MNIVLLVNRFFKLNKRQREKEVPDGYCPKCWAMEEFGASFYQVVANRQSTLNKSQPDVGWIQNYIEKNLKPIILVQKNGKLFCGNCKQSYDNSELTQRKNKK